MITCLRRRGRRLEEFLKRAGIEIVKKSLRVNLERWFA